MTKSSAARDDANLNQHLVRLHDGKLRGIVLGEGSSVSLLCRQGARAVTIEVKGVLDLYADNFRDGNTILSADLLDRPEQLSDRQIHRFLQSDRPDARALVTSRWQAQEGGVRFLMVESSYGCDLGIAFRDDGDAVNIIESAMSDG